MEQGAELSRVRAIEGTTGVTGALRPPADVGARGEDRNVDQLEAAREAEAEVMVRERAIDAGVAVRVVGEDDRRERACERLRRAR